MRTNGRDDANCFVENPRAGETTNADVPGGAHGALRGMRVAVKDNVDVRGMRAGAGNPTYLETRGREPATAHAPCVDKVLAAGARFVGKTHMDELAWSLQGENFHYGTPTNARGKIPGRIPGGSSSGSASAVCCGHADVAIGTDTIGSVRLPASFCGVYGARPTHGRVDATGVVPLSHSFDTVGWFTKDAKTLRVMGEILLDPETRDAETSAKIGRGRLAACSDAFRLVDPAVKQAMNAVLSSEGVKRVFKDARGDAMPDAMGIVHLVLSDLALTDKSGERVLPPITEWSETFRVIQTREVWDAHGGWIKEHKPVFGPGIRDRFRAAEIGVDAATMDHHVALRERITNHLDALLADGTILILPAARGPAPAATDYNSEASLKKLAEARSVALALGAPASLARLPCVVIPAVEIEGEPVGLMLMSRRGTDEALLAFAEKLAWVIGLKVP
ncbi:amidase family protein [Ostreococcus tauri]|uniref:Amidase family protein n=1 Tax=Ostreococcus tauri TaxID=70448 RepID=A0A1Y5IGH7_OSTTA|nr:amidase family protein [Ostreococcus tauri]